MNPVNNEISNLSWYKIEISLKNIFKHDKAKAHPISVIEAMRKEICRLAKVKKDKVIAHIIDKGLDFEIKKNTEFRVEFLFFNCTKSCVETWGKACTDYFSTPGVKIRNKKPNHYKLLSKPIITHVRFIDILNENPIPEGIDEICLNFLSPLKIKQAKGKWAGSIEPQQLVSLIEKRIDLLFSQNIKLTLDHNTFDIIPCYWKNTRIPLKSSSNPGQTNWVLGYIGPLFLKGSLTEIWPYLLLCSNIHLGAQLANSQGYFKIETEKAFFVDDHFSEGQFCKTIQNAAEHYDWLIEDAYYIEQSQNIESYAQYLSQKTTSEYKPEPFQAFYTNKKNGSKRLVEKPCPDDLIIQFHIKRLITPYFEKLFEDESVGFRKGRGIEKSIALIEDAIKKGYEFVFETDIEDFFPSVNIQKLKGILEYYLPKADSHIKSLLFAILDNGYALNKKLYTRQKGLSQGGVLSPLLANLYLDHIDELIKNEDVKLIRFADDLVILAKSMDAINNIKNLLIDVLSEFSLKIKKEKTNITHIANGFTFLGTRFNSEGAFNFSNNDFRLLKKTLYVTEPGTYLKVNGEALHVNIKNKNTETIPLRRLSSIIMLENGVLSTILLKKCTRYKIPVTFTSNGYYSNTIKPDSKLYFNIAGKHYMQFHSLNKNEKLWFAKEFAIGKIYNVQTMFKKRYVKNDKYLHQKLNLYIEKIEQADNIDVVRGLEGAATKNIYIKFNALINDPAFKLPKRDRFGVDPMNNLMNYGFYLLFSIVNAELRTNGLNPYLGFLHSHADTYESLAADVEELFRCFIYRLMLNLVNLNMIKADDFTVNKHQRLYLTTSARKKFLIEFEKMMLYPINGFTIRENIHRQTVLLRAWAEDNTQPEFFRWEK